MRPDSDPDPLNALLEKAQPYLDDAGFTARVLAALPPRRQPGRARAAVLASFAVAAVLALGLGPARAGVLALGTAHLALPALAALALSLVVFAGTALSVALREAERW